MKKLLIGLIKYYKEIPLGIRIVNFLFQRILRIDADCKFSKNFTSRILNSQNLVIDKQSKSVLKSLILSGGCYIQAGGGVFIGEDTIIGPQVAIISWDHDVNDYNKPNVKGPIKIGKNCWIGCGSKILNGVDIGDNCVVAAGAVVTKSFPNGHCVIGGVPAQVIKLL